MVQRPTRGRTLFSPNERKLRVLLLRTKDLRHRPGVGRLLGRDAPAFAPIISFKRFQTEYFKPTCSTSQRLQRLVPHNPWTWVSVGSSDAHELIRSTIVVN